MDNNPEASKGAMFCSVVGTVAPFLLRCSLKKNVEALGLTMAEVAALKDNQDLVVPHTPQR